MKVLITGIQGQLGHDIAKVLDKREVDYYAPMEKEMDVTDRAMVLKVL